MQVYTVNDIMVLHRNTRLICHNDTYRSSAIVNASLCLSIPSVVHGGVSI